jgi:hypothetical protein
MDAILNNPFRILGLPTTASDKEIAKRVSDLLIYAEMGKKVSYETDFPFLGKLDRSVDAIKLAAKKIELPENKIFYSLLCFDLKDNFEKDSIELLAKGDFEAAINVLKNEIYNNCPIIYRSDDTVAYILKNFKQNFQKKYAITIGPPKGIAESIFSKISNNYFIIIYSDDEVVDIQEGYSEINLTDKYQIAFKFNWVENHEGQDVSIRLGFIDSFDTKHFLQITNKGVIRFFKSDHLETEIEIDKAFFHETKSNSLALLRYDNFIEVRFNGKVPLKIEITESFKSSFLCFSGKQKVLIENLSISSLKHFKLLSIDDEINENTFSYSKNISIIHLVQIMKIRHTGPLLSYFTITGNYLKKPYFNEYTKRIISNNYIFNFNVLADVFVREFCLSLKHLIDPNKENSQFLFYNSFSNLSVDSEKKVIEILSNSKPHIFENYIKEISLKRVNEPGKAYEFACELKNESVYFFNWYTDFHSEFHNFHSYESKSISDKIGNEILECSISYYNAISPKTIEIAKQSLKLMTWASDFAFSQVLRDRINKNISILLNTYPNTEYKIVDFGFKDRTRTTRRITPKEKPAEAKTNNVPPQKANNNQSSTTGTTATRQPSVEQSKKTNEPKHKILKSIFKNAGGLFLIMLPVIVMIYLFFSSVFSGNSSLDNQTDISKPIENKVDNNSPIQSKSNLNIDLSNYKPNQQQAEDVEESKWKGNKLSNGDSPYDDYFGKGIYDYNSECYLIFKNGYSTDAIVCLENTTTGRTIRNEYIQAGTDFKMTNIPEGVYKVKTFSGNDWNPEKTLGQGAINGAFDTDLSFSISDNPSDLIRMTITETGEGISYSTGEITLYKVSHGNMQQRNINSDEFFK